MIRPIFALFLSLFLFAACDSADNDAPASVRFNIEMMDGSSAAGSGSFTFDREPAAVSNSTGSFSLSTPTGDPVSPITVTSGDLDYAITNGDELRVTIADPNLSDTGLQFDATYDDSGFSGTWGTITLVGYTEVGTFEADDI